MLPSAALEDPSYRVPPVPDVDAGVGWLRAHVARFSEGEAHRRRRGLAEHVIAEVGDVALIGGPTRSLLRAMGLPESWDHDVALVTSAYQPHAPQSAVADAAADRLVLGCGGRTEVGAARVGVLVQAHAATLALLEAMRTGSTEPPVPATRRVGPDGIEVVVGLAGAPFGRGPHRCPGEVLALRLAGQVQR